MGGGFGTNADNEITKGGETYSFSRIVAVVCMTKDPRIPTMPGRSTSGFHTTRAGIACIKREGGGGQCLARLRAR